MKANKPIYFTWYGICPNCNMVGSSYNAGASHCTECYYLIKYDEQVDKDLRMMLTLGNKMKFNLTNES